MSCYCSRQGVTVQPANYELPVESNGSPLVIFGSRDYASQPGSVRDRAERVLAEVSSRGVEEPDYIISGGADGADAVAEAVSMLLGVPMVVFSVGEPSEPTIFRREQADNQWIIEAVTSYSGGRDDPRSGRGAYLTRNCLMAEVTANAGGAGFAIYNGDSSGTGHMLDSCRAHGVDTIEIWRYDTASKTR
ncbi:hypothetical protein D3D01_15795 [Haloarcula sp. Atlit-7R]|nr:hypothetical protein D3D01_15795 [Haloarcula sp. Atlit-7R]